MQWHENTVPLKGNVISRECKQLKNSLIKGVWHLFHPRVFIPNETGLILAKDMGAMPFN